MPHLGDNAIYKLARVIGAVETFDPEAFRTTPGSALPP